MSRAKNVNGIVADMQRVVTRPAPVAPVPRTPSALLEDREARRATRRASAAGKSPALGSR
ncbi:MAG: hypothetical protein U5K30_14100 [Acidimicrobiales bacterium]|nr:hypothetical protein [Acidimicrobiales bacterium]